MNKHSLSIPYSIRLPLAWRVINAVFLALVFITMVLPMWNVAVLSSSTAFDASAGGIQLWWKNFSLEGYQYVFETAHLLVPFLNSSYVAIVGTLVQVLISALAGYVLIQKDLPFQNAIVTFIMVTMMIPGDLTMISIYQLNKTLNLTNSLQGLVINGLISGFGILMMRSYFLGVPFSARESASIDGATELQIFWHIYLPVSLPGIATIAFLSFVGRWNALILPAALISDQSLYTLPLMLKTMVFNNSSVSGVETTPENAIMAAIVISTIPMVLIYVFAQKYLVAGMTLGANKE